MSRRPPAPDLPGRELLALPEDGDLLEIRAESSVRLDAGRRTVSWVVKFVEGSLDTRSGLATLTVRIKNARWSGDVDGRVTRQRESIDMLLAHLRLHCPELQNTGNCQHLSATRKESHEQAANA